MTKATPGVEAESGDEETLSTAPEPASKAPAGHRYDGPGERVYPHATDPRTGHVLVVSPGDVVDFGEGSPPLDGFWYDTTSGLPCTGARDDSPASTGAGQEEGD